MASSIPACFTFKGGKSGFKVEIDEAKDCMDIIFPEGIKEEAPHAEKLRRPIMDSIRSHSANDDFKQESF
ncbi:MAG: hypothetical protein GF411_00725 [Candidatus Lokiarchaeota archaeon]|nr:hypothetical protein [Candidatus Lokiarchaeota archaeon]